ncbi:MAG: helix-turn-helix transcriptional regulator [Candidatus Sericytochromatia bacterium]|nr:helix-turn-helix transcriptional regulator [Candidatus Tanganyikabacteria bacterium]
MFGKRWQAHAWGPPVRGIRRKIQATLEELVLEELEKRPQNGLGLIESLSERFRGWLPVGADAVYPLLALLEDRGQVERGAGNVFSLTDAGRARLEDARLQRAQRDAAAGEDLPSGECPGGFEHGPAWLHHLDAAKLGKIKDVVHRAFADIRAIAVG